MSVSSGRLLSLPEEFVLLSHLTSGKMHGSTRAVIGCAAAELGELALRRRLLVRSRKSTVFGVEVHLVHGGGSIELLDTTATGLQWADEVLAELRRSQESEQGHVSIHRWFRRRHQAFSLHRTALTERGVLRHKTGGQPWHPRFLARERRFPDPAIHNALTMEVRAVAAGHVRFDPHALFLSDLIDTVGLSKPLGISWTLSQRMDRNRGAEAVECVPEILRDTSAALTAQVPTRDNDVRFGRPRV